MNILPGTKISLEAAGGRVTTSLMGVVDGVYVVLRDIPAYRGLMDFQLGYGETVVLRFLHEGTATGFRSYVLNMVKDPERLLFVAYPNEIQRLALRRADRVRCTLPVQLAMNGEFLMGVLADFSETGCQCVLRRSDLTELDDDADMVGQDVDLATTGMDGEVVELAGAIQRMLKDERRLRLGIRFDSTETALFNALQEAVSLLEGI